MLNKPVDDIIMENGKVVGVKSEGEVSLLHSVSVMVSWGLAFLEALYPVTQVLLGLLLFRSQSLGLGTRAPEEVHVAISVGRGISNPRAVSGVQGVFLSTVCLQKGFPSHVYGGPPLGGTR